MGRGLIYRKIRDVVERNDGLHGLAQDQDNIYIQADMTAREHQQEQHQQHLEEEDDALAEGEGVSMPENAPLTYETRQLRDIVRDSTEQWQLPTKEANLEYLQELRNMGFQAEELKSRMAERRREYQQMLAVGCTRAYQSVPQKIPNLDHIRVRAVSAGYAHVMILSDEGRLYGAGYNDRGQLGLG